MITLIELYDAARLPIVDRKGNRLRSDFILKNANKIVKSISASSDFDLIIELEENAND